MPGSPRLSQSESPDVYIPVTENVPEAVALDRPEVDSLSVPLLYTLNQENHGMTQKWRWDDKNSTLKGR